MKTTITFILCTLSWRLHGAETLVLTNLPATVRSEILTNVVAGDNQQGTPPSQYGSVHTTPAVMNWGQTLEAFVPYRAADERWVITNLVQRLTLTVRWGTNVLGYVQDTVLASTTNRWRLRVDWEAER